LTLLTLFCILFILLIGWGGKIKFEFLFNSALAELSAGAG
jgi:hypothetical protein